MPKKKQDFVKKFVKVTVFYENLIRLGCFFLINKKKGSVQLIFYFKIVVSGCFEGEPPGLRIVGFD